ncbi:hypothetical protein EJB05_28951, partial [Eragrostis curvula]
MLPWLVSPSDVTGHRHARCIFSPKSSAQIRIRDRRWVTSPDDGTAKYWLQTSSWAENARGGIDLLTGSAAPFPSPATRTRSGGGRSALSVCPAPTAPSLCTPLVVIQIIKFMHAKVDIHVLESNVRS